jgi:hypothetical protein
MTPYSHFTNILTSDPLRVPLAHAFDSRNIYHEEIITFSDIPKSEGGKELSHVQNALAGKCATRIKYQELRHAQHSQQECCHAEEFQELEIEDDAWAKLGEL